MPGFTDTAKHVMLAALIGRASPDNTITHISIHTAMPTAGANEVTGGDPAYSRAAVSHTSWAALSSGEVSLLADINFVGPASSTASHFGIWDGATFLGGGAISGDTAFNSEGEFTLQAATKLVLDTP